MLFSHGFRDGKSKPVVMAFAVSDFIDPIKTVKEVLQFLRRDLIPIVDCAENCHMAVTL